MQIFLCLFLVCVAVLFWFVSFTLQTSGRLDFFFIADNIIEVENFALACQSGEYENPFAGRHYH